MVRLNLKQLYKDLAIVTGDKGSHFGEKEKQIKTESKLKQFYNKNK